MHSVCDMNGVFRIYHQPVSVVSLFSVDARTCNLGGFPTIHNNDIMDLTASCCLRYATMLPLNLSANTDDDARLDICVRGVWNRGQNSYFDVRVFHSNGTTPWT